MRVGGVKKPRIYDYIDVKAYLRDVIEYKRKLGNYSTRAFAEKLGLKNPNYLKLVVDGKRSLSPSLAKKLAKEFRLRNQEREYFVLIVEFQRASELDRQNEIFQELRGFREFRKAHETEAFAHDYFSNWYVVVIMEGLRTVFQSSSPEEIARRMNLKLAEVEKSLKTLEEQGLIRKTRSGWKVLNDSIQTPPRMKHLNIRNFHKQMLQKAVESLDRYDVQERSVGGLSIPLSEKSYDEVQNKIREFFRSLNIIYSNDPEAERVYQLNYQLFPVIEEKKKKP